MSSGQQLIRATIIQWIYSLSKSLAPKVSSQKTSLLQFVGSPAEHFHTSAAFHQHWYFSAKKYHPLIWVSSNFFRYKSVEQLNSSGLGILFQISLSTSSLFCRFKRIITHSQEFVTTTSIIRQ